MKGWIFGSASQRQWTQQIYKHKHKFQNPLHQNYKHVKTLQSLLKLEDQQIHSVVVFMGNSQFKTTMPDNVTYGMGYIRHIHSITDVVLSLKQTVMIINAIESGRLTPSFKTTKEHIQHVNTMIAEKERQNVCPNCGSEMVKRKIKKGLNQGHEFWGCSTYPKCRSKMAING
jgi:restriction system protein